MHACSIRNLTKEYVLKSETVRALRGVSFDVPEGDYVAIMGPSGSGKSTLLNLLGCLDQPSAGELLLGKDNVAKMTDDQLAEIRSRRIGFVFQSYNLIQQLTVVENIQVPLYYQGKLGVNERRRCIDLAERVGLGDRLTHRPNQLSGGQQQRVAIARSLVNDPYFILADEATGNLDSKTTAEILSLFDQLNDEGRTIIMVTHEDEVAERAKRIVRLRDGLLKSDVRNKPEQRRAAAERALQLIPKDDIHPEPEQVEAQQNMFWMRTLSLGVKSLWLHPLRSLLTVLGIFIGVASVIWLLAISEGISNEAQRQIESLGADTIMIRSVKPPSEKLNAQGVTPYGLTRKEFDMLQSTIPTIKSAIPIREIRRQFQYKDNLVDGRLVGCSPEYADVTKLTVDRGHFISDAENFRRATSCVLAARVADRLFPYEDPIGKRVYIPEHTDYYTVVGVLRHRNASAAIGGSLDSQDFSNDIYIPIKTLQQRIGDTVVRRAGGSFEGEVLQLNQITVRVDDINNVKDTASLIESALRSHDAMEDVAVVVPLELLEQARTTRLMFMVFMGLVAAISLLVGGIGIMNIMLATVTERTREIGVRRALGAKQKHIISQFLVEAAVLSVVGGISGILAGVFCKPAIVMTRELLSASRPDIMASLPDVVRNVTPSIVPESIPIAFFISLFVGIVFGLFPAIRAAKMNPIDALRHE